MHGTRSSRREGPRARVFRRDLRVGGVDTIVKPKEAAQGTRLVTARVQRNKEHSAVIFGGEGSEWLGGQGGREGGCEYKGHPLRSLDDMALVSLVKRGDEGKAMLLKDTPHLIHCGSHGGVGLA